ncbi:MAG: type II CRISPR RNA-guided endonuclease Cas9, partial [Bifidobacteriaceae bacterium]|nr:type II CRISPR RNA-guided endonuclease Cas9 [Bifidobacteriaceae bacterium]
QELIDNTHASPAVKRGIRQTLAVVADIKKAVGYAPKNIYIEITDEVQASVRTYSRTKTLESLYSHENLKKSPVIKKLLEELKSVQDVDLRDNRIFLYFLQEGKDAYTGEPITCGLDNLSKYYDIDHIIPRSVRKDDSLDNFVLTSRSQNARKTNSLVISPEVQANVKVQALWKHLVQCNLMSKEKYDRLTRTTAYDSKEVGRFVNRSLVETRQIMKNVAHMVKTMLGDDINVVGVQSAITKDMRTYLGYSHKNREINDYHHAQDALCVASAGFFASQRGYFLSADVDNATRMNHYRNLGKLAEQYRENMLKNDGSRVNMFGFIVGSMRSNNEALHTLKGTDEIIWSEENRDYLAKVMAYKKMLISYKTGDFLGGLYNLTRYSANASIKQPIPFSRLKTRTDLYGGFSSGNVAFMCLVKADKKIRVINIPVRDIDSIQRTYTPENILAIAKKNNPKFKNVEVLIPHISKNQLIIRNGVLHRLQSATEMTLSNQLVVSKKTYDLLDCILSAQDENMAMQSIRFVDANMSFDTVVQQCASELIDTIVCRYNGILFKENFDKQAFITTLLDLSFADQRTTFAEMIKGASATKGYSAKFLNDIFKIGSEWGRMQKSSGVVLSEDDVIVYQSPTGLYCTEVKVRDLL